VFCVVKTVLKFDFRLVINKEKLRHAVTETPVRDRICMLSPNRRCECYKLHKSQAFP